MKYAEFPDSFALPKLVQPSPSHREAPPSESLQATCISEEMRQVEIKT